MREMVAAGEADALIGDRVWKETERALTENAPRVYFEVLRDCRALGVVFPEIEALFGVPQPKKWHPEIDCGIHTLMVLEQAARLSADLDVRFAALVHDLGKATTPKEELPSHPGHERRSLKLIERLAARLPVPVACRELAMIVAEFHTHCHRALELKPATIMKVLERCDAFRRPERFEKFLLACEADARGREGLEDRSYPQTALLRGAFEEAKMVDVAAIAAGEKDGRKIGEAIREARISAIGRFRRSYDPG